MFLSVQLILYALSLFGTGSDCSSDFITLSFLWIRIVFSGEFRGDTFVGEIETLDDTANVIIFVSDMSGERLQYFSGTDW